MQIKSKLPDVGTTIFTVMSALAHKHGAINLSQGFPDFPSSEALIDLVYQYMQRGYNQYAPLAGVPVLCQRLAGKIGQLYQAEMDPETEITMTAGATQGIFTAIAAFVHPGDEVILLEPAYDSYLPSIELAGGVPVPCLLSAPNFRVDWEAVAGLITPKTRMILINTPHNPTGTVLGPEDLKALETLARQRDILVLSDEVYEHLIYDGRQHQSVLRYPELRKRSLAVYSFGKTFHNTGWKLGYCVAPEPLMHEFRKVHQFNVFCVNTPIQYALADYLEDPQTYLELPEIFRQKRDFFLEQMKGSRLRPLPCEGTYFQLFDYREISNAPDTEFANWLTTEVGVGAIPVSVFYSSQHDDRVIRLCFAKKEETLARAGERLRAL
jgi:methionine aminotransferase